MQAQAIGAAVCPECGTRLEGAFSRNLGRCMICLLRVGFDDAEEPDQTLFAPVTDRLGNYRIEHHDDGTHWELGRGAMGVTYRAIDTSLQRPVALKLIASEWVKRGAEARERFMREARTAAALRHPNVATVYHFGIREENGQCFCAMELVEGETLEMRVRRTGPLDALTTIDIALQVSSALAAAEKQGLVHRDLKPANLMVVEAPLSPVSSSNDNATRASHLLVKVIDFGVAKALVEKPDAMGLTHGGFVGTPAFASPEQFTDAPVDVRSDIYSLGATVWYLLTGKRPFQGATIEQIRASQRSRGLADRTTEGGTCSKPPYFPARVDACLRTGSAPECPRTHVAITRLPRTDPRPLEIGAPIGSCGRFDRDRRCGLRAVPSLARSSCVAERGACKRSSEEHCGSTVSQPLRRQRECVFRRRHSGRSRDQPGPDQGSQGC